MWVQPPILSLCNSMYGFFFFNQEGFFSSTKKYLQFFYFYINMLCIEQSSELFQQGNYKNPQLTFAWRNNKTNVSKYATLIWIYSCCTAAAYNMLQNSYFAAYCMLLLCSMNKSLDKSSIKFLLWTSRTGMTKLRIWQHQSDRIIQATQFYWWHSARCWDHNLVGLTAGEDLPSNLDVLYHGRDNSLRSLVFAAYSDWKNITNMKTWHRYNTMLGYLVGGKTLVTLGN